MTPHHHATGRTPLQRPLDGLGAGALFFPTGTVGCCAFLNADAPAPSKRHDHATDTNGRYCPVYLPSHVCQSPIPPGPPPTNTR